MLIVIDSDNLLSLYNSIDDAAKHLEAIDVENNEYEIYDDSGQKYLAKLTAPITAFNSGEFTLCPEGIPNKNLLLMALKRVKSLNRKLRNIDNPNQLINTIKKREAL